MTCFLFGHHDAPKSLIPEIRQALDSMYADGVRKFIVGNYGNFDIMAAMAMLALKNTCSDVHLYMLTPWNPEKRKVEKPEGFNALYYPPIEKTPLRFAIVKANNYVLSKCDRVICYVCHEGNTRKLREKAAKLKKVMINLAEEGKNSDTP